MTNERYIVKAEELEYTNGALTGKIFYTFYYNRNKAVIKESTDEMKDDQKDFLLTHNVVDEKTIGNTIRKTIA